MKKLLKKFLPDTAYSSIKQIYRFFIKPKHASGISFESVTINENIFDLLDFKKNEVTKILNEHGYSYDDSSLSWHYHIFAGWSGYCDRNNIKVKNILEIGTHDGGFTHFLSKLFSESTVYTIDLPQDDQQFVNTYNRETSDKLKKFLKVRDKNLKQKNTKFIELNSINILSHFSDMKFDAIWIDGDHHDPQVTIDLVNCMNLLNSDGIMCNDDVIQSHDHEKTAYASNESFKTLQHLEKNKMLKNLFVVKRSKNSVSKFQKYISVSKIH
jgi:predicted O-methyltransferase YrrM